MIEVLNTGSGATSASRDKFPRSILPRTFDYGFATGLMVKDVRLYLDEAKALGVPVDVAETIGRLWETAARDQGPDSDFTAVIKPLEKAAGVTVGCPLPSPAPGRHGNLTSVTGIRQRVGEWYYSDLRTVLVLVAAISLTTRDDD
jgi:hypothetical protein